MSQWENGSKIQDTHCTPSTTRTSPIVALSMMTWAWSAFSTLCPPISVTKSYFLSPPVCAGEFLKTCKGWRILISFHSSKGVGNVDKIVRQHLCTYLFNHHTFLFRNFLASLMSLKLVVITREIWVHRWHVNAYGTKKEEGEGSHRVTDSTRWMGSSCSIELTKIAVSYELAFG